MISLTLSRFPFVLVMLGFTNILCMPFIQELGAAKAACCSVGLTFAFFTVILIYHLRSGLSFRRILETKLISGMSGAGCLIGAVFLVAGLAIMANAVDIIPDEAAVEDNEGTPMTKYEQIFFGSTFVLLGVGVATMSGVGGQRHK